MLGGGDCPRNGAARKGACRLRFALHTSAPRQTDGPERLQRDRAVHGVCVGVHRIKRIRRQLGLRCRQKRRFRGTTDSCHTLPVAPNVLGPCFQVQHLNQVWVSDMTYVATDEGWLSLAGLKDLHSGRIVGYAMADHQRQSLVIQALEQALQTHRPPPGLIGHSDRGSQYCAGNYQQRLRQHGLQPSMSRRGNCYDNAPIESFWGTLKTELIHSRRFETRQQAISCITEYIELFYNRQPIQARLGYLSPAAFEQRVYQHQLKKT